MVRFYVIFSGRVQGVGFRWTAKQYADRNNIAGCVCNLPGGDVEMIAEGKSKHINDFIDYLTSKFSCKKHTKTGKFEGRVSFDITSFPIGDK